MAYPPIPNAYNLTSGKIVGAIFRGLEMAAQAEEKLAFQINPGLYGPGQTRLSDRPELQSPHPRLRPPGLQPRDMPSARRCADAGSFPSLFRELPQPNQPDATWGLLGTPMGSPWDLDGTSVRRTLLEKVLYAKSPIRESFSPAPPSANSIPPTSPRPPIFTRNPHRIIDLQEGKSAI